MSLTVGCGGEGGHDGAELDAYGDANPDGWELPENRTLAAAEPAPLTLTDSPSCLVDADCGAGQMCFQLVCARAEGPVVPVIGGLKVTRVPDPVQRVAAGQSTVKVRLGIDGPLPVTGLPYRLERTDSDEPPVVQFAVATANAGEVEISIPAGEVGVGSPAHVNVVTAAGNVNVLLSPMFSVEGGYAGEIAVGHVWAAGPAFRASNRDRASRRKRQ